MKKRGNIAVLLSNWNHESQEKITKGIWKKAKELSCNVSVFTCQGGKDISRRYDIGEYNIYELVNLKQFDGIIMAGQTIMAKAVKDSLIRRIQESGVPAVCLEERITGFVFVGIDNYRAMYDMFRHLCKEHSYLQISYITGPADNYESNRRLQAYLDSKEEYGLEGCIWQGDYTFESGRNIAEELCRTGEALPQVIACANDDMALGVCHVFKQNGIKVPQEVAVTGFDNNYYASHYSPGITSVERPKVELGYMACEVLLRVIGGSGEKEKVMDTSLTVRESCGCGYADMTDYEEFRERTFWMQQQNSQYHVFFRDMNDEMLECDNFGELFRCIRENLRKFVQEEVAICLNKTSLQKLENNTGKILKKKNTVSGYEDEIYIPYYDEERDVIEYMVYPSEIVFPGLWEEEKEYNIYVFTPLHFRDKCFGFIVLSGSMKPLSIPFYFTWVQNISNAFEELQNISLLSRAVEELNELSIKDTLTGVYNRSAILRFLPGMIQKAKKREHNLLYCFVDMDRLKIINDEFGHKVGDQAIITVAEVLKEVFCQGEMIIRYGGDEFLIVAEGGSESWMEERENRIACRLRNLCEQRKFPFFLSVSIGYHVEEWRMENTPEHCIKLADERMYRVKCAKSS